jgi:hypothetical protein
MSKHSKLSSKDKSPIGFWVGLEDLPADPIVLALAVEMCRRGWKLRQSRFEISIRQLADRFSCSQNKIRYAFAELGRLNLCSLKMEHQKERIKEQNVERASFGKVTTITLHYALKGWNNGALNGAGCEAQNRDHINIISNIISNINTNNNIKYNNIIIPANAENDKKGSELPLTEGLEGSNPKRSLLPSQPSLELVPPSESHPQTEPDASSVPPRTKQRSKEPVTVRMTKGAAHRVCMEFNNLDLDDAVEQLRYLMDEVNQYWQPKIIAIRNACGDTFWEKHFIIMDRKKREKGLLWGEGDDGIKGYYKSYQVAEKKKQALMAIVDRLDREGKL